MDINKVILVGRLTRDPELRYGNTGTAILKLSIANTTGYGDHKQSNFFDGTYFGKGAEAVSKYLSKGKQIAIEGELKQNKWEKDGQTRSKVEIHVTALQLLGGERSTENKQSEYSTKVKAVFQGDQMKFEDDIPF